VPQVELTLNILRPFGPNSKVSAYEGIHGRQYDFKAHPLAPCGTHVLVHETPQQRTSWASHGVPGFYLGPALAHYRSFRVFVVPTQAVRISDTLAWFPKAFNMPGSSVIELVHASIRDLTAALQELGRSDNITAALRQPFDTITTSLTTNLQDAIDMYFPRSDQPSSTPALARFNTTSTSPPLAIPVSTSAAQIPSPTAVVQRVPVEAMEEVAQPARVEVLSGLDLPALPEPPVTVEPTGAVQRVPQVSGPPAIRRPARASWRARPAVMPAQATPPTPRRASQRPRIRNFRYVHDAHFATLAHAVSANEAVLFEQRAAVYAALNLSSDGKPLTFSSAKAGPNKANWFVAEGEEISRLIDSSTIRGISHLAQPIDRRGDTTYYNPQPKEKTADDGSTTFRIRGTAGGDRINYPGDVAARTAEMEVVKALLHSAASDRAAGIGGLTLTADIKDYYLGTPMERPEYVRIPVRFLPSNVMDKYALHALIHNGAVLFEINKCMYGLPQAGLLSQRRLIAHLAEHGYIQDAHVACLFRHAERGTTFTLVVDDFAVKYRRKEDADHFIATLQLMYELKVDWTASKYLGYTIEWDDIAKTVALSMPQYVPKLLARFFPGTTIRGAASPAVYTPPNYGAHIQDIEIDESPPLDAAGVLRLQEIVGSLLFYARAVDSTMLPAVNHISSEQARPTARVMAAADRLLQYAASYPANKLVYKACDMQLCVQSDASYHSRSGARSVAGGILYCGNADDTTTVNGALLAVSCVISTVCSSVAEAEYAACFINAQHAVWLRVVLEALGYPQRAPTPLLCDNLCAVGLANNTVKAKRSKAIDMRYHWVRDRIRLGHIHVYWRKGADNLADFYTKALPVHRHQELMPLLVQSPLQPDNQSHSKRARRSHAYFTGRRATMHTE
jgi:hypothetical protein